MEEEEMKESVQWKRIGLFLLFAFGLAWLMDLVIFLNGGLEGPGAANSAFLLLLATMAAPALGNLLARLITREGWGELQLRPRLRRGWPYWAAAWLATPLMTLLGAAVFFALFPAYFDSGLTGISKTLAEAAQPAGQAVPVTPAVFLAIQIVGAIILSPILNGLFTLGEEFGWRAYLLPKLMPLGRGWALVLTGIIWGIWHWPVIAMGYNYGLDYSGAPWLGLLAMAWFTIIVGVYLGALVLEAKSVWPAVIGHAAVNGIAAIGVVVSIGDPNPLLGPAPVGVIGSLPFTLAALWILWRSTKLKDGLRTRDHTPKDNS
jgi:membrane protease YdiL (CAAX protease family)